MTFTGYSSGFSITFFFPKKKKIHCSFYDKNFYFDCTKNKENRNSFTWRQERFHWGFFFLNKRNTYTYIIIHCSHLSRTAASFSFPFFFLSKSIVSQVWERNLREVTFLVIFSQVLELVLKGGTNGCNPSTREKETDRYMLKAYLKVPTNSKIESRTG